MKKITLHDSIRRPFSYYFYLLKNWSIWITAFFSLVTVLIGLFIPKFIIPQHIYWIVAIVGILWASYSTYFKLLNEFPYVDIEDSKLLSVFLRTIEGNEYSFTLNNLENTILYDSQIHKLTDINNKINGTKSLEENETIEELVLKSNELKLNIDKIIKNDALRRADLQLNVKIENYGKVNISVLNINCESSIKALTPWFISYSKCFSANDNSELTFPIELPPQSVLVVRIIVKIYPDDKLNRAQFATKLPKDHMVKKVDFNILTDIINKTGYTKSLNHVTSVSFRPLRDLTLDFWREEKHTDLLDLFYTPRNDV